MATPNTTEGANTYLPPCPVVQPFLTISNITRARYCVVNVIEANTYVVGQVVNFFVPEDYKMVGIQGKNGEIIAINGLNFTVDLDTRLFNAFVIPSGLFVIQPATLSPSGSRNIYNNTTVPFHSAGNFGN
jgi:hypothetical protein